MVGMMLDSGSGDLQTGPGGVVTGDTGQQTAETVVRAMRGEFKEYPLLGGEAPMHMGALVDPFWPGELKRMLRGCGVDCCSVMFKNGVLIID